MELTTHGKRLRFRTPSDIALTCRKKPLADRLYAAKTLLHQGLGLIGRRLQQGEALLFLMPRRQRFSLHMLFVFTKIDVIFCDVTTEGMRVIEIKKDFTPFTCYTARKQADLFIELPRSTAARLRPGDIIATSRKIFKRRRRITN